MKPRNSLSMYVLLSGVMGLSIVGGILAFQIFSAVIKSQTTAEQKTIIKPIDGGISKDTIDHLAKRIVISESNLLQIALPTPTPAVAKTLVATESATPGQ